jgi:galactokinase/mevalonate kinase-like predicted kinase
LEVQEVRPLVVAALFRHFLEVLRGGLFKHLAVQAAAAAGQAAAAVVAILAARSVLLLILLLAAAVAEQAAQAEQALLKIIPGIQKLLMVVKADLANLLL